MQTAPTQAPDVKPVGSAAMSAVFMDDGGLGLKAITGEMVPRNRLLRLIAERIRVAAATLRLTHAELASIFGRHSIFEGETQPDPQGRHPGFILVETHHCIQGKVGKGALKLIFPRDLLEQGPQFRETADGAVEVRPPDGQRAWASRADAERAVREAMREFMVGESLSMSLKSQATGAPFAGSEGLILCAFRAYDPATGRYCLKPALRGEGHDREDKELIEGMMNQAAELLTRAGRIAYDKIVHAAETNSTLTARLDLQLPTNVVEGHLRALLAMDPGIIIGDDDMTARLRELLAAPDYTPTACALARAAARMQIEHSILLPASRDRLRRALAALPVEGVPTPAQYREIISIFFGTGETQQNEDQLYHRREPILKALSVALSARSLDECGDREVLAAYLRNLLDNQRILMEVALLKRLPGGQALTLDWFERARLLSRSHEARLAALVPPPGLTRDKVKESFWEVVNILCEARAEIPRQTEDPYLLARREVLERATRAITSTGDLLPSVDRIVFFTLPLAFECVTPKLGVITRKPAEVCGSELRPEAMAAGGVMSTEILLKKLTGKPNPLRGMTIAIEGLGNAGKHVATTMMQKGAVIVGVSDSRGAVTSRGGFSREEMAVIITHKNSGRRLDTLLSGPAAMGLSRRDEDAITFHPEPEKLKQMPADILILSAIPGSIHRDNAPHLRVKVVCELTGAAVSSEAKRILRDRQIHVVPDNLASSGGLLVSLSEMLQNSAGQNWDRRIEEHNLYEQLSRSYEQVLRLAEEHHVDASTASDMLALQRMRDLAVYRERLEAAAAELGTRIRQMQPGVRPLIVSDDDEDGVASAAILHTLIAHLNPAAADRIAHLGESFRSARIPEFIEQSAREGWPVRDVFVLDRAYPRHDPARARLREVAGRCRVVFINNHDLPPALIEAPATKKEETPAAEDGSPAALGVLLVSPQTLRARTPAREFPTAMILKELAHQLVIDAATLVRIDWQAAVGSYLDAPAEPDNEWLWFYAQFNPDRTLEAARALRLMTRAGGFDTSIQALLGVTRPDQLDTHDTWERFMAHFRVLDERVQVLVEKIVVENRRRPFTAHFFSREEVASPATTDGAEQPDLNLYHWISEHLTRRGDLGEKPIIVGQVIERRGEASHLGVRIRSPRGVDLMEVGLPPEFKTGGLPNTAVAVIPLAPEASPEQVFHDLVDAIWMKTTSPLYFASPRVGEE